MKPTTPGKQEMEEFTPKNMVGMYEKLQTEMNALEAQMETIKIWLERYLRKEMLEYFTIVLESGQTWEVSLAIRTTETVTKENGIYITALARTKSEVLEITRKNKNRGPVGA